DCVATRKVASTSSGSCLSCASVSQALARLPFWEKAADGPRTLPFHDAGEPPPSETLPAYFRSALAKTTGASARRAASRPIAAGRVSLENFIAAIAASAVRRSFAATAAIG